jgi:hypothetical protein
MKLKQSKNEKELGEAYKEFAENRTKKKIEIRRNMHKYRDEKWKKANIKKQGWRLDVFKKEIDHEIITKIIK